MSKRSKNVKKRVKSRSKTLKKRVSLRYKLLKSVIKAVRTAGFDPELLEVYKANRIITAAEFKYAARKLADQVLRLQQQINFNTFVRHLALVRYHIKRNWRTRSLKEVKTLLTLLPKLYQNRSLIGRHYLTLMRTVRAMDKRLYIPKPVLKPFVPLKFTDLRLLVTAAMKIGDPITPEDLLVLRGGSAPGEYKAFIKAYGILIDTYNAVVKASEEPYFEGEFTPNKQILKDYEEKYDQPIKLGKKGLMWLGLETINDESNRLYTLMAKGPRARLKDVLRKTNKKSKKMYVFGLFEWLSSYSTSQYNLKEGDLVIWGFEWASKKGKAPYDYIQKVYEPINFETKKSTGGYRRKSEIEDVFESRFVDSDSLGLVKFLGLYIPIKQ